MNEKITITQEQADAIEVYLEDYDKRILLEFHADTKTPWSVRPYKSFNELSQMDMARALLLGYEVEPKYKAGDWVARVDGSNIYPKGNVKVIEVGLVGEEYVRPVVNEAWGFPFHLVRHATPEEIAAEKNRQLWESIDREIEEFKDGDVGIARNGAGLTEKEAIKSVYKHDDLVGFYPVESFISFEGDSND